MTLSELPKMVLDRKFDDAVELALQYRVVHVKGVLDYVLLDEHAEVFSEFLLRWVAALPPLERLEASDWLAGNYLTSMVHVAGSYGTGARLLLAAQGAAVERIAQSMRNFWPFTDGPDAETHPGVAHRLFAYAGILESLSFSEVDDSPPGMTSAEA